MCHALPLELHRSFRVQGDFEKPPCNAVFRLTDPSLLPKLDDNVSLFEPAAVGDSNL